MPSQRYSPKLKKLAPFFVDAENWRAIENIAAVKEQEFESRTQEALYKKNESNQRGEVISRMHPRIMARLQARKPSVVAHFEARPETGWARKEDLSSLKDFLEASRELLQNREVAVNVALIRLGAASMHMDANKGEFFYPDTQEKMTLRRITLAHKKGFLIANFIKAARKYKGEEITEVPAWISEFKSDMPKAKTLITLVLREGAEFSGKPSALAKENITKFVHGVMSASAKQNAPEALSIGDQEDPEIFRLAKIAKKEIWKLGPNPSRKKVSEIIRRVLGPKATHDPE